LVARTGDLIDRGYFGPRPQPGFSARAGDLAILPFGNESVWWFEEGRFSQRHRGHHGGLSRDEMEIPFLALKI